MDVKNRYCRSRKASMPVLQFTNMDYSMDFSDPIKNRSMSTSTPMATKSISPLSMSVYSPGNDSGYPDSIVESRLSDTTFMDSMVTRECPIPEDLEENVQYQSHHDSRNSDSIDWEVAEEEDVFEKKKPKRLSDFPRYSLEFESSDLDLSFGASGLADKLDSVAINDVVKHFSPREPDRLIGRKIGLEKVDILAEMSARNIHSVSLLLSYLHPEDLCRVRKVSKCWRTLCDADGRARAKREKYVEELKMKRVKAAKENLRMKSEMRRQQRGLTTGNVLTTLQFCSTPKSPKKTMPKMNLFAQAISNLRQDETLRHCPKCHSPAKTVEVHDRGVCINEKCKFDFCVKCFCEHHGARSCIPVASKKTKLDSVGSKKSKKNLRRL